MRATFLAIRKLTQCLFLQLKDKLPILFFLLLLVGVYKEREVINCYQNIPSQTFQSALTRRKPVQVGGSALQLQADPRVGVGDFIMSLSSMEFYKVERNSFRRLVDFSTTG